MSDEEELAKLDLLISQAKSDIRVWQKERRAILNRQYQKTYYLSRKSVDKGVDAN